jgi:hypothetical protein
MTLILGIHEEPLGERHLPLVTTEPPLGIVEQTRRLSLLARHACHRDPRPLPDVMVVDLGHRRADASLELRLDGAQEHPLLLQRVSFGEVELARQDPDPAARHARIQPEAAILPVVEAPARLADETVRDFVANAHGDLDYVRAALASEPALANAAWDWGGGDWETALGAAAHMGRRDIAELLLANGARLDVFAAAMLGDVEVVRGILASRPETRDAKGPHGIPLRAHAEAGGEQARDVLELLDAAG